MGLLVRLAYCLVDFTIAKSLVTCSLTINRWNKNKIKRKRKSKLEHLIPPTINSSFHFSFHHHLHNTLIPVKHSFYFIPYKHPNIAIIFHYFTHTFFIPIFILFTTFIFIKSTFIFILLLFQP